MARLRDPKLSASLATYCILFHDNDDPYIVVHVYGRSAFI